MSGAAFAGVSRRGLLALVALGSVSGCGGPSVEEQAAKDRYITLIKQDPMFTWTPPGNLRREVFYSPMNTVGPKPDQSSSVVIEYLVSDPATIPGLVKQAQDASVSYGYSRDGKRFAGLVQITFDAHPTIANDGFYITFEAPTV